MAELDYSVTLALSKDEVEALVKLLGGCTESFLEKIGLDQNQADHVYRIFEAITSVTS